MNRTCIGWVSAAVVVTGACLVWVGCDSSSDSTDSDGAATNGVAVTSVAQLESKTWTLQSYGAPGSETAALAGATVTAAFSSAGHVGGDAGCNSYGGSYVADDTGNLSISGVVSTMMLCLSPAGIMAEENALLSGLQNASAFQIEGGTLHILYGAGQRLNFN